MRVGRFAWRLLAILLGGLVCGAYPVLAVPGVTIASGGSSLVLDTSTTNACSPTVVERFTRHALIAVKNRPQPQYALLRQFFEIGSGCFESFHPARVSLTASPLDIRSGKLGSKPLWSVTTEGISGEIADFLGSRLYRVTMPGCCGAAETSAYFSLRTGKLVASSADAPLLSVASMAEHDIRFVSVESNIASSPRGEAGALATLFIGDSEALRQTITVSSASAAGRDWWVESLRWRGDEGSPTTRVVGRFPDAVADLVLRCRCEEVGPVIIALPIAGTELNLDQVQVSGLPDVMLKAKLHHASLQRLPFGQR